MNIISLSKEPIKAISRNLTVLFRISNTISLNVVKWNIFRLNKYSNDFWKLQANWKGIIYRRKILPSKTTRKYNSDYDKRFQHALRTSTTKSWIYVQSRSFLRREPKDDDTDYYLTFLPKCGSVTLVVFHDDNISCILTHIYINDIHLVMPKTTDFPELDKLRLFSN